MNGATKCEFCLIVHTLTVPTVHLNGTAPEDLRDQLQEAVDALYPAIEKLTAASPNARDYYVQDAGAMARVTAQHELRLHSLEASQRELIEMLGHVQAVMDYRDSRRGKQ